ncbi:MAG: uroporphyrinogen-III synthase [Bacteroidales bacterium]|jgi:uroporphyrinogen-III synthase|nr:uroporphyrinogen-III synthase [Bacteroidales bacterium]
MSLKVKKILVSQPKPTNDKSPYFEIAEKHQVEITFRPFIKVERLPLKDFRQQRIQILDFSAIVFTARTAVDNFFSLCEELRITMPESMKYFCNSESIALYLQKYIVYRKRKIFFSQTGKIEGLSASFTKNIKEKFLLPVSELHNDDVASFLEKKKLDYTKSIMYRTVSNDFENGEKLDYDMLIFFSPLGVSSLLKNFPDFKEEKMAVGCFGKATIDNLNELGIKIDCEAPVPGIPSMTAALDQYLTENHKKYS